MTDTSIPGTVWTWEVATGFARTECQTCKLTMRSMDYDRLRSKAVEHSTTHLYTVNPEAGPQAGNLELAVIHKITYHMSHFADPAYTFNGGRAWCQCGWNTSGTNERDLMEDVRIHMATTEEHVADYMAHADGTPWFTPAEGVRVRRGGTIPYHWFTATCTRCGWDVDSRNNVQWTTGAANHTCQAEERVSEVFVEPYGEAIFNAPKGVEIRLFGQIPNHWHTASCLHCGWNSDSRNNPTWKQDVPAHKCAATPDARSVGLHHTMTMTAGPGNPLVACSRCNWYQSGDNRTTMAELANIHAASHTDEPTPAVGMTIHYQSFGTPGGEYPSTCRAGIITDTTGENGTSIAVFNPDGIFLKSSILYDPDRSGGTWHWPHD